MSLSPLSTRRPLRRTMLLALAALLAVTTLVAAPPAARATPIATTDAEYGQYGRVFPDPQGGMQGAPNTSPYIQGNVPAVDFIQYQEAREGLAFLETVDPADFPALYPDGGRPFGEFIERQTLSEDYADVLKDLAADGNSAGVPNTDSTRTRFPLTLVKVTDEESPVPEADRFHYVYSLSMHGIERAGVEGGIRAIEDFVTFASTTPDAPLLELDPTRSATWGETLENSVIYFALPNPDGWARGDTAEGKPFYQRYNGNGIDLNRDFPGEGFVFRPYTPLSEPESAAFHAVLIHIKESTTLGRFIAGTDLHGQLNGDAFSYTLLGGAVRSWPKNDAAINTMRKVWFDQETKLDWSELVKANDAGDDAPGIYGDQYGTIWDTLGYINTGSMRVFYDSPIGLDGLGLSNEMSFSHLSNCGVGKCFIPEIEQLHVDGNKAIIYTQVNTALQPRDTTFRQPGHVGYVFNPQRLTHAGSDAPGQVGEFDLPPQDSFEVTLTQPATGELTHEFEVLAPEDGVYNGGLTVDVTFVNAQGVSPAALTSTVVVEIFDPEEEGAGEDGWQEVNRDFNQSGLYAQAGMTVNVNGPVPGQYRVRLTDVPPGQHQIKGTFFEELSWPDPGQNPYDVSNMDFFTDISAQALPGHDFTAITPDAILNGEDLDRYDTIILADQFLPGWRPFDVNADREIVGETDENGDPVLDEDLHRYGAKTRTDADRDDYLDALADFARGGGQIVLTDSALEALEFLPSADGSASTFGDKVNGGDVYGGAVEFNVDGEESYLSHRLGRMIEQPGSARGANNRHQVAEPVPTGFAIQNASGGDLFTLPQFSIDRAAWEAEGGATVGMVRDEVTYGELPYGEGQIRVIGSLLPMPTDEYDNPFGLGSYALTYTGYQVFDNLVDYVRPGGTWRLGGDDRFSTATEVAYEHHPLPDTVVIARADDFADALAAVPLAKELDAPIILAKKDGLDGAGFDYLLTRNPPPTRAYVIGGEEALGQGVIDDLDRLYVPASGITRLGGEDRFATAVRVAEELETVSGVAPTTAVVATGRGFPDALAAGPVAGNLGADLGAAPLLLVEQGEIPTVVADWFAAKDITATVVAGGPVAVSDDVVAALPSATRIAGETRFDTAVLLADELVRLRGDDVTSATVAVADNFPDALVVGSAGGRDAIPTLLTPRDQLGTAATTKWLTNHAADLRLVYIAGGTAAVGANVDAQISAALGRTPLPSGRTSRVRAR